MPHRPLPPRLPSSRSRLLLLLLLLPLILPPSSWPRTGVQTSGGRLPYPGGCAKAEQDKEEPVAVVEQDKLMRFACEHVRTHARLRIDTTIENNTRPRDLALPLVCLFWRGENARLPLAAAAFSFHCLTLAASLTSRPWDTIADLRERILRFCK